MSWQIMSRQIARWQIARRQIPAVATFLLCTALAAHAGGPAFVAGSGYNAGVEGQPLLWTNAAVQYYTNPAALSPILTEAQADALVASAFSAWTSIPGVALTATQGGHLAEDVTGSNIVVTDGVVTAPADITPSATSTPLGIVYDYDGTVTDAILGEGAGDLADCFNNTVYGGPDNFSAAGNIVHALVVINGICAATTAQLPDVQYRLVRVLGRTVGLGWSQANLNVQTGNPTPTSADYAGFSLMHFMDLISCVPITVCYGGIFGGALGNNTFTPAMDDIDSLTRLYPGSAQTAGRIYGSVYFTDASGNAAQLMQGVNVVARLMVSGQPSRQYVATSVSGFLFCGNAGNIVDGYVDGSGLPYNRWGSDNLALEGSYDLGQLPIPSGQTTAQYQLSVEALDPMWSQGVEPYAPTQVTPSGSFAPALVTIQSGSNTEQNILMLQDEIAQAHPGSGSTYANPAALPQGGAWGSWISGYGSVDFFQFTAQANRTASVAVTALDESGQPTETKLLPVIGIWELSDQSQGPAPASTPSAFNSETFGMSRLDVQFNVTEAFRVGVADFRGDGRPDYFYQASLLYSDSVTPPRLSLAGGIATLQGIGFNPAQQVTVCSSISPDGSCVAIDNGATLSASASQIAVALPAGLQDGDGVVSLQLTDPTSGAYSQMIGALTYGAAATDLLLLLQGAEPATPIDSQAANPIRVRAVAVDGVTPVSGATIAWSATNGLQFSVCGAASSCSVLSDEVGESSSWVTPTAAGASTITIALAPASYSLPTQQATVLASSSTLNLAAVTPTRWIAQGATIAVPLTVEALNQTGAPQANVTVDFSIVNGTATLSAPSATTNSLGFAAVTANLTNLSADVQVSACVAPNNTTCSIPSFVLHSTSTSRWTLETVSGSSQFVLTGQSFQPLVMRVTDGSSTDDPVLGVSVAFQTTLARVPDNGNQNGGSNPGGGSPVILGSPPPTRVSTDQNGLASIVPSALNVGPCDVFIAVTAGPVSAQFQMENLAAIVLPQPNNSHVPAPSAQPAPPFAAPSSPPQPAPDALFALPIVVWNNQPDDDSRIADSPETPADNISGDRISGDKVSDDKGGSPSSPTGSEKSVSPPGAALPSAAATAPEKPAPPIDSDLQPTNIPSPAEAQSKPASNNSPP